MESYAQKVVQARSASEWLSPAFKTLACAISFCATFFFALAFTGPASACQEKSSSQGSTTIAPKDTASKVAAKVAAKVGDCEIKESRVDRHLEITIGKRKLSPDLLQRARAEACEHLVRRQIVFEYVRKYCPVPESEIRSELSILEDKLAKVDQTIEQHLEKTRMSLEELKNEIAWRTAWQAYLDKRINKESMTKYFGKNRPLYDGTEVRIAQIVFEKTDDIASQIEVAKKVRASIGAGKISWEAAVKENSVATESKKSAGEIGWVRHREPMPEAFGKVAVQLNPDQISQPLVTTFGVHLIKCLERKAGKVEMADVQEQLRADMTRFLFEHTAEKHRSEVEVNYSEGFQLKE